MKTRAITGFFFVIVMLGSMLLGPYVFACFYLLLPVLCLSEFYGLIKQTGHKPNVIVGIIASIALYIVITFRYGTVFSNDRAVFPDYIYAPAVLLLVLAMPLLYITELYKKSEAPFINLAYSFFGIIFAVVPFTFFAQLGFIGNAPYNFHLPLGFMLMLWANDTGAYLTGRAFGKHKLFERHSPKKTWEGFIGGVLISAGVGLLLSHYYVELAWMHWVIIALIISCFGTLGDLVESMFKRSINVKDSGGILPGHGGLLDRFDGLLMAAPLVWAYVVLVA